MASQRAIVQMPERRPREQSQKDPEEEARNHERRAAEQRLAGQVKLLKATITRHPLSVPHALATLQNLGYTLQSTPQRLESSRQQNSYVEREDRSKRAASDFLQRVAQELGVAPSDIIPQGKMKSEI